MSEFYIEFDLLDGHNPGTGDTLYPQQLAPYDWRSIGNSTGGRFINRTGVTIRAIHIKTNNSANTFRVDVGSIGRLFDLAYVKDDGSEAYFMGANIPNMFGAFWMRVPANTFSEIQACDAGQGCPFVGQVYEDNPPAPSGPEWLELRRAEASDDPRWVGLRWATPSEHRDIQCYAEHENGREIIFVSRGQAFVYDHENQETTQVSTKTVPAINRISTEGGKYLFWSDSSVRLSVDQTGR